MNNKIKYEKNEYGHYRIFIDGLEFYSLRQAKIHMKKKNALWNCFRVFIGFSFI